MTRRELVDAVAYIAGTPTTTINPTLYGGLQNADLLPLGGKGETVDLSASHKVNLLLAAILDRPHGTSAAETVRRWRALPLTVSDNSDIARNFALDFRNAGTALDSIVTKVPLRLVGRSPIFEAKLGGEEIGVAAEFHAEHMVLRFYGLTSGKAVATLVFGTEPALDAGRVERIARLLHPAFVRLAAA
jgi:hypothetical protein